MCTFPDYCISNFCMLKYWSAGVGGEPDSVIHWKLFYIFHFCITEFSHTGFSYPEELLCTWYFNMDYLLWYILQYLYSMMDLRYIGKIQQTFIKTANLSYEICTIITNTTLFKLTRWKHHCGWRSYQWGCWRSWDIPLPYPPSQSPQHPHSSFPGVSLSPSSTSLRMPPSAVRSEGRQVKEVKGW